MTETETIDRLKRENEKLRAELVAAWIAIEEMRWPDIPGVEFWVCPPIGPFFDELTEFKTERIVVHPAKVEGIYRALRVHAARLFGTGVNIVKELDQLKAKLEVNHEGKIHE